MKISCPILAFVFLAVAVCSAMDPAAIGSLFGPVDRVQEKGDGWLIIHVNGKTTRLTRLGSDKLTARLPSGKIVQIVRAGQRWQVQGTNLWIRLRSPGRYDVKGGMLIRNSGASPAYTFRDGELFRAIFQR